MWFSIANFHTDLLLRDFQGLQVVAHNAELLLKLHNFAIWENKKKLVLLLLFLGAPKLGLTKNASHAAVKLNFVRNVGGIENLIVILLSFLVFILFYQKCRRFANFMNK